MTTKHEFKIFGDPLQNAVEQMDEFIDASRGLVERAALMADHHLGYSLPIGGVVAMRNHVSPAAVGYDIGCGNTAFKLDIKLDQIKSIDTIMDEVVSEISFGVGRPNGGGDFSNQPFFSYWRNTLESKSMSFIPNAYDLAHSQFGTVGSGNHYVDIFHDREDNIWVGVHFGSRGLGHKIAARYIEIATESPVKDLLDVDSDEGHDYIQLMCMAGEFAMRGRHWVCSKVSQIIADNVSYGEGGLIREMINNHHNFAWLENNYWVMRKGSTPNFFGQPSFIGGTMCDKSYITVGRKTIENAEAMHSTIHGAGRILSRTAAAGKTRRKNGKRILIKPGLVSRDDMAQRVRDANVCLRGANVDESPHCYKKIDEVISYHRDTLDIVEVLTPIGVAMAGDEIFDPYKD